MHASECVKLPVVLDGDTFNLNQGGVYQQVITAGAWNSGSVTLGVMAADGTTFITGPTLATANVVNTGTLGPGTYKLNVTSATTVTAQFNRVPYE